MRDFNLLIGGQLVPGAATIPVINPATENVLADAPRASLAQLNGAVAAAKASFAAWSARPLPERGKLLVALADAFAACQDDFARLLTEEQGKPLPHAAGEISHSIDVIRYFSSLDLPLQVIKEDEGQKIVRQHTPLGVVAAITPGTFRWFC
jgi:acyl-CoA reductase-like NAD-dependent aldehyde dehydrogenase